MCGTLTYDDAAKAQRNSLIAAIQAKVDDAYNSYKNALYAGHAYLGVAADLAVLGLSGAGSVIADAAVKSILATTSAGVVGATASFDKQVLNQQNMLALVSTMDAQRDKQAAYIISREQAAIEDYTLDTALLDLRKLYIEGSVLSALQTIQGNAQKTKNDAAATTSNALGLPTVIAAPLVGPAVVPAPAPVVPAPAPVVPSPQTG